VLRKLTLGHFRVRAEEGVGDDESEHGVADELERLVVQRARLALAAGPDRLVRPRAVRQRALQKSAVAKLVIDSLFERGGVGRGRVGRARPLRFGAILFRHVRDCNKNAGRTIRLSSSGAPGVRGVFSDRFASQKCAR
jgi:hypothetical protein